MDCGGSLLAGTFKTFAAAPAQTRFVFLSDSHEAAATLRGLATSFAGQSTDFILHGGDMTNWGNTYANWRPGLFAPLAGIIDAIHADLDTPPLHPFLVHAILRLGNSEFVLRLPAAFPSILCIPLMFVLARRLLGRRTGLLAALMMALSPFAVYYAQEARMYALMLMFTLLTVYCLVRALAVSPGAAAVEEQQARGNVAEGLWWTGFVLAAALGLYNHFFGFLVLGLVVLLAALVMIEQWRMGRRLEAKHSGAGNVRYLALALLAIAVLYLPWSTVLLSFVRENYSAQPYGQAWQANLNPQVAQNMVILMLGGYWAHPVVRWGTRLLFVIGLLFLARRRPAVALWAALCVVLPFVLISVLNPGHFVTERYFSFMLPMLILGMAEGLRGLADVATGLLLRLLQGGAASRYATFCPLLAVCLVVPLLSASGLQHYYAEPAKPGWRQLAHYVAASVPAGDMIIVATFPPWDKEPLQHYLAMGGRRVVYAAEEPNLRQLLAAEDTHPWWIVYAGAERRLGRRIGRSVGKDFAVVPFDYLALLRRNGDPVDALDDGQSILKALAPLIPGPYRGEVERVLKGLQSPGGDMGQPIAPPIPTTVK